MKVRGDQVRVGRILHEDDAFLTLEVAKDDARPMQVEDGDAYLTLLFVHRSPSAVDPARLVAWLPWDK